MSIWHRLAHWTGWNMCYPDGNGYRCAGCGKFTPWWFEEPPA